MLYKIGGGSQKRFGLFLEGGGGAFEFGFRY